MKKLRSTPRCIYAVAFAVILAVEVLIALFVRDKFIRPYGGDILVMVLICCFGRIFFPEKVRLLPLWVFLFAAAVEVGQYFDFVSLMGLGDITFFRILFGSTFSFADIICYGVGCLIFALCEGAIKGHKFRDRRKEEII
ncbi:MAG: DUF2809 domain-containing protein [Clostridia bacterium]|nr:DUF2809 domain-containing protein [Clostridia bacterium]